MLDTMPGLPTEALVQRVQTLDENSSRENPSTGSASMTFQSTVSILKLVQILASTRAGGNLLHPSELQAYTAAYKAGR